jgi:hypothetical protein
MTAAPGAVYRAPLTQSLSPQFWRVDQGCRPVVSCCSRWQQISSCVPSLDGFRNGLAGANLVRERWNDEPPGLDEAAAALGIGTIPGPAHSRCGVTALTGRKL